LISSSPGDAAAAFKACWSSWSLRTHQLAACALDAKTPARMSGAIQEIFSMIAFRNRDTPSTQEGTRNPKAIALARVRLRRVVA
jgi:hypothetical protein